MKLLADAHIPGVTTLFQDFDCSTYQALTPQQLDGVEVLITRSNIKLDAKLLENTSVKVVATPSSGCDHIDANWLDQQNIRWFHAPGCNAQAVAEYVLGCTAILSQLVPGRYRAGIIGVGHVGLCVANYFNQLGYEVLLNDPPRAEQDNFDSCDLEALMDCDLITIHTPLIQSGKYKTAHCLNEAFFKQLKPGCAVINTARGGVLDTQAALAERDRLTIIADVFEDEPNINPTYADNIFLATPHIAGHSIEGKTRGILQIQSQIYQHFNMDIPSREPESELCCFVPQHNWEEIVLRAYDPRNDRLTSATSFASQRNHYRIRHEHRFCWS